ncbi:C45 family peptidase [Synechococcus sp. Nb3U1]|uniref:C45 family autoproteolytic acyltransferase/hydolase n=1 Tax=Synechococcus sp. Nb3U1 TaxID=1914529 RepID=UPI001F40124F|nr:C45 family peptidase [Synechococcus sp. Nb3U1]MCF2970625.1 C45 family peptidase [Synechococcus sp. Nb3U1]
MFPILHLHGDPQQRGQQYGSQAAPLIRHSIASYARQFAYRCGLTWQQAQTQAQGSLPRLERHTPHLLEEMQGMATGSGFTFSEILALNLRTEILAGSVSRGSHPDYKAAIAANRRLGVPEHLSEGDLDPVHSKNATPDWGECTTLAALPQATSTRHTYLAQTWDWIGDQRQACVLLRVQSDEHPNYLTLTEAGILAKIGLNQAGLAVALNLLRSQQDGQTQSEGMPVHLLLRLLLQCEDDQQALERVKSFTYTASSCVSVASATGQVISFELSPQGIGLHLAQEGILAHTNHVLDPALQKDEIPPYVGSSTTQRLERAYHLLRQSAQRGSLNEVTLQKILQDRTGAPRCICRHPDPNLPAVDRTESVAAVVMDLTQQILYVAPGLPDQVEFVPISTRENDVD